VVQFVEDNFIPVRVHVKEHAFEYKRLANRFAAHWTPTILVLDPDGEERHRIEGFLPMGDFLSQLKLGLAKVAFALGQFADAEKAYQEILEQHPNTDAAPEAQYWAGVSRYKASGDSGALKETARLFAERYKESTWAKKASVWAA